MNVKAIQMSDLFKVCDDIYTSVMIISQRARQIIDQRVVPIVEDDEVEERTCYCSEECQQQHTAYVQAADEE